MLKYEELADPDSCINKANENEWVFVLLGRDAAAPYAIRAWAAERIRLGKNRQRDMQICEALAAADSMEGRDRVADLAPEEKPLEAGSNPSAGAAQSGGQLQTPMQSASESPGPQTHEEARQFHEGVLSGLTIYARESGHSTLKSDNHLLRRLMDEQGWKTIEMFESLPKTTERRA